MKPTTSQIPQTIPQANLNIPPNPQGHDHHITELFVWDTASQGKAAMKEQPAPIDKNLLWRLDRFDEYMKKNQGVSRLAGWTTMNCIFSRYSAAVGIQDPQVQ